MLIERFLPVHAALRWLGSRFARTRAAGRLAALQGREADRFRFVSGKLLLFALAAYGAFLAVFLVTGLWWLAALNVASILADLVALGVLRRGAIDAPFTVGGAVLAVHALTATALTGIQTGFFVYLPVLTLLTFMHPRASRGRKLAWGGAVTLAFIALITAGEGWTPVLALRPDLVRTFVALNAATVVATLAVFVHLVIEAVDAAEEGLEVTIAKLAHAARTDPLTDLLNRRSMEKLLDAEATRLEHFGGSFALLLADVDDFKAINDTHGHPVGDHALCCVARTLRRSVRRDDRIARWGGEEFLVLLPGLDLAGGVRAAERLREAVAASPLRPGGLELPVTITVGVASHAPGAPLRSTVAEADRALYAAKALGKNRVAAASHGPVAPAQAPTPAPCA